MVQPDFDKILYTQFSNSQDMIYNQSEMFVVTIGSLFKRGLYTPLDSWGPRGTHATDAPRQATKVIITKF